MKQSELNQIDADLQRVQPIRPKGKWTMPIARWIWQCSECNSDWNENDARFFKFCPNCGADMQGDNL